MSKLSAVLLVCVFATETPASAKQPARFERNDAGSVRAFPWLDGTYDFGDGTKTHFSGGSYADLGSEGACNVCMSIRGLSFGDVDGDGREEALMVVSTNLGGAGTMISGYVFRLSQGVPELLAEIEGGDRGEGGLESLAVRDGSVIVRRFVLTPSDGVCCPSRVQIETWRWADGKLRIAGKPTLVRRAPRRWSSSSGSGATKGR